MTQPPSESFVATFETCLDVANLALASGDKPRAMRALQAAIQAISDRMDMRRELFGTLVRLGSLELELDSVASARTTFREALTVGESSLGFAAAELIPALKGLASASIAAGALEEARALVGRASDIADQYPDAAQGTLAELLNDVSRFYFRQGAYADAEPLLQRLLTIKRAKGEDHPEVATVTASLATTRQALGRYEAAEQLWRRVLAIREKTLAPSHFSLATTLEHLADCCAARGKLAEALTLSERAVVIREVALGTDHASVRSLRERIGDMRMQAAEASLDEVPLRPTRPSPAIPELGTGIPLAVPAPPAPPPAVAMSEIHDEPEALALAPVVVAPAPVAPAQFQSVLLDIQRDLEHDEPPARTGFLAVLTGLPLALRERRPAAIVGTSAVVVTMAGAVAFGLMQRPGGMQWVVDETARQQGSAVATYSVAASPDPLAVASADSAKGEHPIAPPVTRRPSEERTSRPSRAEPKAEPKAEPSVPTVKRPVLPKLDSVVSQIDVPQTNLNALGSSRVLAEVASGAPAGTSDATRMVSRARLIGTLPTPAYPQMLDRANIGGEVRVRFEVDSLGRPVMATFAAVGSPNPRLVDAVKKVVAPLRFEPARSAWPENRPLPDQVELAFQFQPRGRG